MKMLLVASFSLALLLPACAFAESGFNGSWKMDPSSMRETGGKPMVISMKDGMYNDSTAPPISIKADGEDHAISGHPEADTVALKVVNDHSLQRTDKKDGKTVWAGTFTVAADGKTATGEGTRTFDGSNSMTRTVVFDRVGNAPSGSNAASGSWRLSHMVSATGDAMTDSYQIDGDKVEYKNERGTSYTATLGGKTAPVMRDGKPDGTVAVKSMGKNVMRETFANDGKVRLTSTMTLSADGNTLTTSNHSMKTGATTTWVSKKQ